MPPTDLATVPAGAAQVSPLVPGASALEDVAPGSLDGIVIAAPPGTLERRYVLALALRALKPGASLTVMAPKEKGGSRLAKELESVGCVVEASGRRHQRICQTVRPEMISNLDAAIDAGAPRFIDTLRQWSQPGVFSWESPDPGTQLLISVLPALSGRGADLEPDVGALTKTATQTPTQRSYWNSAWLIS